MRIELGRAYARTVAARPLRLDPDGPAARILLASIEELARLHLEDPEAHPEEVVLEYLTSLIDWATERASRP